METARDPTQTEAKSMETTEDTLIGHCPNCGESISTSRRLIRYERNGEMVSFASCPGCGEVVRPIQE